MEPPPPPASSKPASPHSNQPLPPTTTTKLRLMCSYGGHIIPRPNKKSLFYAGGETRIVALDRLTAASSLSALASHLSRALFNNRPFHLKYQIPNEGLDSLISVTTDEDLFNMLEEHDRINQSSTLPARIRLFLFPVKPESLGSSLLDPKSETWFSDALKSTRILQKGESADTGLLMDLGLRAGSDLEAHVDGGSNSGCCGGGAGAFESKHGAESLVLETSSSFGSTCSSISMSNLPPIGVAHCDETGLQDKKTRVPSSASIESDNSFGSAVHQTKTGMSQEPLIQVSSGTLLNQVEYESNISASPSTVESGQIIQQLQPETQYIHGAVRYIPQYPTTPSPISHYYPVYQMPIHQQQQHISYPANQSCPIYLVPVRPSQYHNMPSQYNFVDTACGALSRPPLPPQTTTIGQPVHREVLPAQHTAESSTKVCVNGCSAAPLVSIATSQGQQLIGTPLPQSPSESVTTPSEETITQGHGYEFNDDIAYNPIYKTQPSVPVIPSQYQTLTKGATLLFSDSSVQKHQPAMPTS